MTIACGLFFFSKTTSQRSVINVWPKINVMNEELDNLFRTFFFFLISNFNAYVLCSL